MSLEVYVFLRKSDLPTRARWQEAIEAAGFDIVLNPSFDPGRDTGFVPCTLRGVAAGFEFSVSPFTDVAVSYPSVIEVLTLYDTAAAFYWGSSMDDCAVAIAAAATLTSMISGVLYDPQDAKLYDSSSALQDAREIYAEATAPSRSVPTASRAS